MPERPDDKMHLTQLQQLVQFFKQYGIKRTSCDKDGKHKPKNVVTLRAEFKALPQSEVVEAWQRYQQAMGGKRKSVFAASVEDDAEAAAANPGAS